MEAVVVHLNEDQSKDLKRIAGALEGIQQVLEGWNWHDTVDGQDGIRVYSMSPQGGIR